MKKLLRCVLPLDTQTYQAIRNQAKELLEAGHPKETPFLDCQGFYTFPYGKRIVSLHPEREDCVIKREIPTRDHRLPSNVNEVLISNYLYQQNHPDYERITPVYTHNYDYSAIIAKRADYVGCSMDEYDRDNYPKWASDISPKNVGWVDGKPVLVDYEPFYNVVKLDLGFRRKGEGDGKTYEFLKFDKVQKYLSLQTLDAYLADE